MINTKVAIFSMIFLSLTLSNSAIAAKGAPLLDRSYVFADKSMHTAEQVRGYILAGIPRAKHRLNYRIESDKPGVLVVEFDKEQRHHFSIAFLYTSDGFQANYSSSKQLNFSESNGVRSIHPNYMIWLDELVTQIKIASAMQLNANGEPTNPKLAVLLTFRAVEGSAWFSTSEPDGDCGAYTNLPVVLPKDKVPTILSVPANRAIEVHGTNWGPGGATCGPISMGFIPESGKKYTVDFSFTAGESRYGVCRQGVFDDTNPELRIPVATNAATECKKKGWFR